MFYFYCDMTYVFTCTSEQSYQHIQASVPLLLFAGIINQLVHPVWQANSQ